VLWINVTSIGSDLIHLKKTMQIALWQLEYQTVLEDILIVFSSLKNCSCNSGYLMGAQVAEVVAIPLLPNNAIKNTDRYHRKPCKNVPNDHVFSHRVVTADRRTERRG